VLRDQLPIAFSTLNKTACAAIACSAEQRAPQADFTHMMARPGPDFSGYAG
jgi:hypothetical protein